jgi:hypothetical protein
LGSPHKGTLEYLLAAVYVVVAAIATANGAQAVAIFLSPSVHRTLDSCYLHPIARPVDRHFVSYLHNIFTRKEKVMKIYKGMETYNL